MLGFFPGKLDHICSSEIFMLHLSNDPSLLTLFSLIYTCYVRYMINLMHSINSVNQLGWGSPFFFQTGKAFLAKIKILSQG